MMNRLKSRAASFLSAAVTALFIVAAGAASPAHAGTTAMDQTSSHTLDVEIEIVVAYEPGAASAGIPRYDHVAWAKKYACAYAGWHRTAIVFWRCELYTPEGGTVDGHGGSFGGGSYSTPTYYYYTSNNTFCVYAWAAYADGSGSDSSSRCA